MFILCQKCGESSQLSHVDLQSICPSCGAIYAKVAAAIAVKEKEQYVLEIQLGLLEARRQKRARFLKPFSPLIGWLKICKGYALTAMQAIVRYSPGVWAFIQKAVVTIGRVMAPVAIMILRLYVWMFQVVLVFAAAFASSALRSKRKGRRPNSVLRKGYRSEGKTHYPD